VSLRAQESYGQHGLLALEPKLKSGIGMDFQIAPELQRRRKFTFHQGTIEEIVPTLKSETVD
jgi:hypothetical protein